MAPFFAGLFSQFVFKPVLRPVVRIVSGLVAIPLFRFLLRKILRVRTDDAELERDLEHWFRGAVLLLAATANLEETLFEWTAWYRNAEPWLTLLLRLILAVGVIESMPDQDLFSLLHRGPPRVRWTPAGLREAWRNRLDILRGLGVLHLKRSSPVFAIMCVIFGGRDQPTDWVVGWWCYGIAVTQYLIIALVTDRDRAAGLLAEFDPDQIGARAAQMRDAAGDSAVFCGDDEAEADQRGA